MKMIYIDLVLKDLYLPSTLTIELQNGQFVEYTTNLIFFKQFFKINKYFI